MRLPAALLLTLLVCSVASRAGAQAPGELDLGAGSAMDGYSELRELRDTRDRIDEKLDSRLRARPASRSRQGLQAGPAVPPAWRRGGRVRVIVRVETLDDAMRTSLAAAGL